MTTKKIMLKYNFSETKLIKHENKQIKVINSNINNKIINNNNNVYNKSIINGINKNYKSQENLIEIELKNIHMLILQRSLYIIKRRFEQNKKYLEYIYEKYKDKKYKQLKCISTNHLLNLYKDVLETIQIELLPYEKFNELLSADLMIDFKKEKSISIIKSLVQFTNNNIEKYNTIFYENKMKKKKIKEEKENEENLKPKEREVTTLVKIEHINKRGEIIEEFQKMIENNIKFEINDNIFNINEDDISILINKKLLYNDVIPLIIADFLQENMKNNNNIGIILKNNILSNDSDGLNESLKILYDKEIIKKYDIINKIDPKEEKKEELKNLLFESNNIDNQIKKYKQLFLINSSKGIKSSNFIEMIKKFKEKKLILQKRISDFNKQKIIQSNTNEKYFSSLNSNRGNLSFIEQISKAKLNKNSLSSIDITKQSKRANKNKINYLNMSSHSKLNKSNSSNDSKVFLKPNKKILTKKEIIENNLIEIFSFYCKQHSLLGKTPTIESILKKEKLMNLSEFAKFCKEFKIELKNGIYEFFIKHSKSPTYMTFEEFKNSLSKLAILENQIKKDNIKNRIIDSKKKLKEINEKIKKRNAKKAKRKVNIINENEKVNNNEEKNNEEQSLNQNNNIVQIETKVENITNQENKIEENQPENQGNLEDEENQKENPEAKQEKQQENNTEINQENEEKGRNLEENKNNENQILNQDNNLFINNNLQIKNNNIIEKKEIKNDRPILFRTKEDLELAISKLEKDYEILENKTQNEIEEDFFTFLNIDDNTIYRKKMGEYILPFSIRGKDTRNPEKNVKYPIKFNPKNIRDTYDLLMQRAEDVKKEKELRKIKEKDIQFSQRKKIFYKDLKKLEKDYGERIKKDNYQQIKRSEDNYIKEKNNKLTWNLIQNCDYQVFLLNEDLNKSNINKKNSFQSTFEEIFTSQKNQLYDEDFITDVYSNRKQIQNSDESINISSISSKNTKNQINLKNSNISIDSNIINQTEKK